MANEQTMSLVIRSKHFFGLKIGQGLSDFMDEFKKLTEQDKQDLVRDFNRIGLPTVVHHLPT